MNLFGYALPVEHALVYICAGVVLVYGVLGGLRAAYWTDVIQGMFIILLSVLLIPMGLRALADEDARAKGADPQTVATVDGFRIMHERVPDEYFEIIKSPRGGEFPS
jgi:SSS family solute:Na+ symporter